MSNDPLCQLHEGHAQNTWQGISARVTLGSLFQEWRELQGLAAKLGENSICFGRCGRFLTARVAMGLGKIHRYLQERGRARACTG